MTLPSSLRAAAATACLLGFGVSPLLAQDAEAQTLPRADRITTTAPVPKKSPMNSASLLTDGGYARVVYSQPMLRGRAMLGEQVPFGKVWRLGANEATELFTTAPMTVAGKPLPAGAYSLFAVPTDGTWTLIFNRGLGQWGAYGYDEAQDALRVDVPVERADKPYEALTMFFDDGQLVMAWADARVRVPVSFGAAGAPAAVPANDVMDDGDGE